MGGIDKKWGKLGDIFGHGDQRKRAKDCWPQISQKCAEKIRTKAFIAATRGRREISPHLGPLPRGAIGLESVKWLVSRKRTKIFLPRKEPGKAGKNLKTNLFIALRG